MNQAPEMPSLGQSTAQDNDNKDADTSAEIPGPLSGRRRRFTNDEKRRFLTEAASAGESMSSVGRRYGLSVSLLFRWRRQLDGEGRPNRRNTEEGVRAEAREMRDKVREMERLLGRKTLEAELLKQELTRLGHNPTIALSQLDGATTPAPQVDEA